MQKWLFGEMVSLICYFMVKMQYLLWVLCHKISISVIIFLIDYRYVRFITILVFWFFGLSQLSCLFIFIKKHLAWSLLRNRGKMLIFYKSKERWLIYLFMKSQKMKLRILFSCFCYVARVRAFNFNQNIQKNAVILILYFN